jgi:hypothetical protein
MRLVSYYLALNGTNKNCYIISVEEKAISFCFFNNMLGVFMLLGHLHIFLKLSTMLSANT